MNDYDGNVALDRAKEAVTRVTLDQRADPAKSMKKPAPARTIKMVKRAFKRAGKAVAEVLKQVPPLAPIQSKAGCPWCCYIRLTASVPEVLAVLDYIQETFTAAEVAQLKRKDANIDGYTRGLDGEARARLGLPCPLLKDGSCSVHTVRPLSCRAVASVEMAACRRAHETRMAEPRAPARMAAPGRQRGRLRALRGVHRQGFPGRGRGDDRRPGLGPGRQGYRQALAQGRASGPVGGGNKDPPAPVTTLVLAGFRKFPLLFDLQYATC